MTTAVRSKRGDFFIVDPERAIAAASGSLYQGLAYLVLASGIGPDNRTTSWSTTAVASYLGLGVERAKQAIMDLMRAGFIEYEGECLKSHPRYCLLGVGPREAFLPRSLVEGIGGDTTPLLRRVRETADKRALLLLLALYAEQDLARNAGVPRSIVSQAHARKRIAEVGPIDVCAFNEGDKSANVPPLLTAKSFGCSDWFWGVLQTLEDIGAIEWAEYLFDSDDPDAEPILPLSGEVGKEVRDWALQKCEDLVAATSPLRVSDRQSDASAVLPFLRHRKHAALVSIVRTTHRAKTANAARFIAHDHELANAYMDQVETFEPRASEADPR
jgi:hypothetical protein